MRITSALLAVACLTACGGGAKATAAATNALIGKGELRIGQRPPGMPRGA